MKKKFLQASKIKVQAIIQAKSLFSHSSIEKKILKKQTALIITKKIRDSGLFGLRNLLGKFVSEENSLH